MTDTLNMEIYLTVQNPQSVALDGHNYLFKEDNETTARVEELAFDALCNLWNAALPMSLATVAQSPWLSAMFWRLCRAQAVTYNKGVLSHANRGQQSVAATHTEPAEVRDHPA